MTNPNPLVQVEDRVLDIYTCPECETAWLVLWELPCQYVIYSPEAVQGWRIAAADVVCPACANRPGRIVTLTLRHKNVVTTANGNLIEMGELAKRVRVN